MDLMRDVYINTIVDKLSFLSMKIQQFGHLNLHNISVLSENFYCELLNLIYDLKLKNTNEYIANAIAIDLIDNDNKCYVQVSAQKTPTKVQQSLDKLSQLGMEGEYRFYFLSIAKNAKSLRSHLFKIPEGVVFDSKTDVLDVPSLLLKINTLSAEKLQRVYDYVCKELKYSEAQHLIPSDLVHVIKILSQRVLTCNRGGFDKTKAAAIQAKLDYNRLHYTRSLVARHVTNLKEVAKAYDEYNQSGVNHRAFVLNQIISYYDEGQVSCEGDELFNYIRQHVKDYAKSQICGNDISIEAIDLCCDALIVDAFVSCDIFINPNEKI